MYYDDDSKECQSDEGEQWRDSKQCPPGSDWGTVHSTLQLKENRNQRLPAIQSMLPTCGPRPLVVRKGIASGPPNNLFNFCICTG